MKKTLVLASALALLLSGCNKTETIDGPQAAPKDVSFDTYLGRQTKGLSKDEFKMGNQFSVYGVRTAGVNFNVTAPAFTDYVFVTADKAAVVSHLGIDPKNNSAIWSYGDPTPWDDQKATFFGYSPVPQGTTTFGISNPTIADNTLPTIDFDVVGGYDPAIANLYDPAVSAARELIKSQTDLLWAYSPDNTKAMGAIQMDFRHALSQIRFSVRGYHDKGLLRINSITLKKVMTKGTLKLGHDLATSGNIDYLGGWNKATEPKNFAVNLQTDAVSAIPAFAGGADATPTTWAVTDNDESLMMIPQSLRGLELEIRYSYSVDGKEWQDYESGTGMNFVLSTLSSHWNPNKRYNYILNIYPGKAIQFKAAIDPWEPTSGTADLEYRTFNTPYSEGSIAKKADGTVETFQMKEGDKLTTTYDPSVTTWMYAIDKLGVVRILSTVATTVIAGDAGAWEIHAGWNDAATTRKATLVINRAEYDKTLSDGNIVKVQSGVAKYVVTQSSGNALNVTSVVYGGQNGAIVSGLSGYTLTSYPNSLGVTALATVADIYATEKPFRRVKIAVADAGASMTLAEAITACGTYNEVGAPAGKWRVARAVELRLFSLNKVAINAIAGITALSTTSAYWSTSLQTAGSYWTMNFATDVMAAAVENGTTKALVRCVFEEN